MRKRGFFANLFGLGAEDRYTEEDIDDYDIKKALEDKIQEHADFSFVAGWSQIGDAVEDELKDQGFTDYFMIASNDDGYIYGVNTDVLVPPGLYEALDIESVGHAQLWSTGDNIDKLMKWLKKNGFEEVPKYGGRVPTSEEEVQMDHVISSVAKQLGISEARVKAVAKAEGYGEHAYWSSSGDTELWAK